jgi:hypothetical protein
VNQKLFEIKYRSKSNTVNNMKLMILEKIRVIHTCSSSPRLASVINLLLGTDNVFSSQIFYSWETGAIRQNCSPRQGRVTAVVKEVAVSAITMAECGRGGER